MDLSRGRPDITIGLIDGPVDLSHPDFQEARIETVIESNNTKCTNARSIPCIHGTFIAGILCAKGNSPAPGICSNCKILSRPIFMERKQSELLPNASINNALLNKNNESNFIPTSNPEELSHAIIETVNAGAKIINLSLGTSSSSLITYQNLQDAYDYALSREVVIVIAAGNEGNIGNSQLINHPWVIPVTACDQNGLISSTSNYGPIISRQGLMAPGINIQSTLAGGGYTTLSGTSFATPLVTGTIALLWSLFPNLSAGHIIHSIRTGEKRNKRSILPSILNAEQVYNKLRRFYNK
jgi:subtilisin family serine protease